MAGKRGPYPDVFGGMSNFRSGDVPFLVSLHGCDQVLADLVARHVRLLFEIYSWGQFAADAEGELTQGLGIDGAIELCHELAEVAGCMLGYQFKSEFPVSEDALLALDMRRAKVQLPVYFVDIQKMVTGPVLAIELAVTMQDEYHCDRYTVAYVIKLLSRLHAAGDARFHSTRYGRAWYRVM